MLTRRTENSRVVLFVVDQLLLAGAFALAVIGAQAARESSALAAPTAQPTEGWVGLYLLSAAVLALSLAASGHYRLSLERSRTAFARMHGILWGGLLALAAVRAAGLVLPGDVGGAGRAISMLFWPLATAALALSQALVSVAVRHLDAESEDGARVVVFGMSSRVLKLLATLSRGPGIRMQLVGVVADEVPDDVGPRIEQDAALALVEQGLVDHVIVESERLPPGMLDHLLRRADDEGISVHITSPIFPSTNLLPTWERIGGVPVLGFVTAELPLGARMAKRSFDIAVSGAMLALLALPMALMALLVRLTSPGPAFYVQARVGQGGKPFHLLKYRTMIANAEERTGPVWAEDDDPRCTAVGRFLRRTDFDELPQLVNVLLGQMSLVGPRPERPEFVRNFKRKIPRYAHKHWVRPGITGWAQVHGLRGNTSLQDRVEHDLFYVENWSLTLDIRILVRTLFHRSLSAV